MSGQVNTVAAGWYPEPGTNRARWWNGASWGEYQSPIAAPQMASSVAPTNGLAVTALVVGIAGWAFMGIPFFIGWFIGGPLDIAGVVFGILGIVKANKIGGVGRPLAIIGLVFAGVSLLSVIVGAGSIW